MVIDAHPIAFGSLVINFLGNGMVLVILGYGNPTGANVILSDDHGHPTFGNPCLWTFYMMVRDILDYRNPCLVMIMSILGYCNTRTCMYCTVSFPMV